MRIGIRLYCNQKSSSIVCEQSAGTSHQYSLALSSATELEDMKEESKCAGFEDGLRVSELNLIWQAHSNLPHLDRNRRSADRKSAA